MADPPFEGIQWLFFDWGGTLYDEVAAFQSLSALAVDVMTGHGVECTADDFYERFLEAEYAGASDKLGDVLDELVNDAGLGDVIREEIDSRYVLQELFPETVEVLEQLARRYRLGMISNTRPGMEQRLETSGLSGYFDVRIGSADVRVSKPDPAIFRMVLRRRTATPARR